MFLVADDAQRAHHRRPRQQRVCQSRFQHPLRRQRGQQRHAHAGLHQRCLGSGAGGLVEGRGGFDRQVRASPQQGHDAGLVHHPHQLAAGQVGPAHGAVAPRSQKRVVAPVQHAEAVLQQRVELQAGRIGPAAGQAEIDFARGHLALDAAGVVVAQIEADGGILRREQRRRRRDQLGDGGRRGRHADTAAFQRAEAHHVLDRAVEIGQQAHHARQELLARRREQHAPAGAREQARGQRLFQLTHQAGDRRLGLEQALAGMREAGFLRHRDERGQVLQGDVLGQAIHFKSRWMDQ